MWTDEEDRLGKFRMVARDVAYGLLLATGGLLLLFWNEAARWV